MSEPVDELLYPLAFVPTVEGLRTSGMISRSKAVQFESGGSLSDYYAFYQQAKKLDTFADAAEFNKAGRALTLVERMDLARHDLWTGDGLNLVDERWFSKSAGLGCERCSREHLAEGYGRFAVLVKHSNPGDGDFPIDRDRAGALVASYPGTRFYLNHLECWLKVAKTAVFTEAAQFAEMEQELVS